MIHVYGDGQPGDLVRRILDHARGVAEPAFALSAGLWAHKVHRDEERHHKMHIGTGAGGWALYLDNGQSFAFRGQPHGGYDRIEVHTGSIRPLGPVALTIRKPRDVDGLWRLLDDALDSESTI
ncbi:MAG TPA: hypothetical protein VFJ64_01465 [Solirubrobacterales bacterium]|nr:hypothetical protein [Solirubrobacterales bacterium]